MIKFIKYEASGNDFILIENLSLLIDLYLHILPLKILILFYYYFNSLSLQN